MKWPLAFAAAAFLAAPIAHAQSFTCEDQFKRDEAPPPDPFNLRVLQYAAVALQHRLAGLASYYSASLDGTLTANGERYRQHRMTAAHLTLPLGTWVELTSRATGKIIRVRVNDRGPY